MYALALVELLRRTLFRALIMTLRRTSELSNDDSSPSTARHMLFWITNEFTVKV
jgi:hypothetical protein